ncbi:2Fe-2S iron-sulfur cluster-binding protein [Gloeobacter kilaueensis]|uniref:NADPH-dependent glutamate synthase small subunit n=1 Tax=Gloeobacter kilaueensis (strain ATCC BAA-2537 / CCAP 1431/1 / ULC 316 / JS1) TaxID=1183438 RepID=U5QNE3_GLOK1|nr:2Fe-2S iron-sulfur cluster-binding protein [Gloeobacter kilaueensis]AGY60383.1 NADPH-dependent glutamate synthase small subunit [Gloeobacter kilaueensis JS1]
MGEESTIEVRFLPDDVTVTARSGELLLDCATRAGIKIPTGCLMGSCHACEVEIAGQGPVCSCITALRCEQDITVHIYSDPLW